MITLTDFLLARIGEDESAAREAVVAAGEAGWIFHETPYGMCWEIAGETEREDSTGFKSWASVTHDREGLSDSVSMYAGPHIARHDPARVLAECEAKRRIVADHLTNTIWPDGTVGAKFYTGRKQVCSTCQDGPGQPLPCRTLRLLALPYADHPDYRDEWKP